MNAGKFEVDGMLASNLKKSIVWTIGVDKDAKRVRTKESKKKIGGKMSQRMMIDWEAAYVPVKLRIRLAFIMRTVRY